MVCLLRGNGTYGLFYQYMYASQGNIVRSVDIPPGIEYTYTYEEGKIVRAAEHAIEMDTGGFITSRTFENSITYVSGQFSYHKGEATEEHIENGKLKFSPATQLVSRIEFSDGRLMSYEYDEEERITRVTDSLK